MHREVYPMFSGFVLKLLLACAAGRVPLSATMLAQAVDPNAPTGADDPLAIDRAWQKASAKYDAPRKAILESVDRVGATGPFRPDWESLQNYKVPEWYMDAKFGIFIHW